MTELEKIEYAKSFIDKLASGINPLDETPIPETDIVNNVRLSRCFFYVSDILRQVIENGGVRPVGAPKQRKREFALSDEARGKLQISEMPLTVSEISNCMNSLIDLETTKKISANTINNWLVDLQLLKVVMQPNGRKKRLPTDRGNEFGIFAEERTGQYGSYITVLFSSPAQRFIYDNIDAIIASRGKEEKPSPAFRGYPWTETQDECLTDLFKKNVPVSEIASTLKRSEGAIRARLERLGLT